VKLTLLSAAGNAFAVLEARRGDGPPDLAALAREVCADLGAEWRRRARAGGLPELRGRDLDGLLVVSPASGAANCRMVIYNADGSRPEACGNGLRCVARFARENGWASRETVVVETDAGPRPVELLGGAHASTDEVQVRAGMGTPRVLARDEELELPGERVRATLIDMGNPHCVLFVEDERTAPLERLGPLLECHPRFPGKTNVEFVAARGDRLAVRVWERGVGETAACGTGACAAAVVAALELGVRLPVEVDLPGGRLRVHWDGSGPILLEGPVLLHAQGEWSRDAQGAER